MAVFRPEWNAAIQARPRLAVICITAILLELSYMAAAGISLH